MALYPGLLAWGLNQKNEDYYKKELGSVMKVPSGGGFVTPRDKSIADKALAEKQLYFDLFQRGGTGVPQKSVPYVPKAAPDDFDVGVLVNPGAGPDPWQQGWSRKVGGPSDFGPPSENPGSLKKFSGHRFRKIHSTIKYRKY